LIKFVKHSGRAGLREIGIKAGHIGEIMEKIEQIHSSPSNSGNLPSLKPMESAKDRKRTLSKSNKGSLKFFQEGVDSISGSSTKIPTLEEGISFEIFDTQIKVNKFIGAGNYGRVYEGIYFGAKVAIKKLSNINMHDFIKEVQFYIQLKHPSCVSILGYILEPDPAMVMEYYPNDLSEVIHNHKVDFKMKKQFTSDIMSGLIFLHSKNIIHRDLKPKNILITENSRAKITDFGNSKLLTNDIYFAKQLVGTMVYLAPESFKSYEYSHSSDLYSLSITIWEMFEQKKPFYHIPEINSPLLTPFMLLSKLSQNIKPIFTTAITNYPKLKDLIETYWNKEPSARAKISLSDALIVIDELKEISESRSN